MSGQESGGLQAPRGSPQGSGDGPWLAPGGGLPRRRPRWVVPVVVVVGVVVLVFGGLFWWIGDALNRRSEAGLGWSGPDPEAIVSGFEDKSADETRDYWIEQVTVISTRLQERFELEVFREPRGDGGGGVNCGPEKGFHDDGTFVGNVNARGALMSPIAEGDWEEALQMVVDWAKPLGFTKVVTVFDKSGHHSVEIFNTVSNGVASLTQDSEDFVHVTVMSPCTRMDGGDGPPTIEEIHEEARQARLEQREREAQSDG